MRILFDQGTPAPLRRHLVGHAVKTAHELGWAGFDNGRLLAMAEIEFDALITTDQNLRYQQNVAGRRIAILVLPTTSWPKIQQYIAEVTAAVDALKPSDFTELHFAPQSE